MAHNFMIYIYIYINKYIYIYIRRNTLLNVKEKEKNYLMNL